MRSAFRLVNRSATAARPVQPRTDPVFGAASPPRRTSAAMTDIAAIRHAGHRLRRLRLPRPPCGARAGQARLPHPRRGAPAGPRRPSAAARPRRPDPCRAGQSALRRPRSRRRCATPTCVVNLVGILFERGRQRFDAVQAFGAEQVALAAASARRARWSMSRRSAPTRIRRRTMRAPRPRASRRCSPPRPAP